MAEAGAMVKSLIKKSNDFTNEIVALQKKSAELETAREELEKKEADLARERTNLRRLEREFQRSSQALLSEMAEYYPKTTTAVVTEFNEKLKNEVDHLQAMLATSSLKEETPESIDDITDTLKPAAPPPESQTVSEEIDIEVKKAEKKHDEISRLFKKQEPEEVLFEVSEPSPETARLEVQAPPHAEKPVEETPEPHAEAAHHETDEVAPADALLELKETTSEDAVFEVDEEIRKEPKTTAIPVVTKTEDEEVYLFDLEKKA